jgi:uncharacterized membrane protein
VLVAGAVVLLWFAPSSYQIYLALHAVAAVVWVGGDLTLTTVGIVFQRRGDAETLAAVGKLGSWIGPRIYTPAAFALFGLGVALIEKGNWGWGIAWLDLAIIGWGLATANGIAFVGPELGRIDRDAQSYGPDAPQTTRRVTRLLTVLRLQTALLVLIVIDMVAKPTF